MSIWTLIKYLFICPHLIICALITFYIYREEKPFYTPIYVTKKSEKEGEKEQKVNIHDEFPCFCKLDRPYNIIKLYLGVVFLGLFRVIINLFLAWRININILNHLKSKNVDNKNKKKDNDDIKFMIETAKRLTSLYLKFAGMIIDKKRLPDERVLPIYQKYFGPDYKIDYDSKFSCYISNHTCAYDMLEIIQRQKDFIEGKAVMPFMIFPEGTTNSGRHLLPFKRGAFNSLLPVKATIIHPNLYENYHLGCGSSDVGCNYIMSLSNLYNKVEYIELPVITPNDYMYKNFEHLGKEKWEIFANVSREIMCELGGFKKSEFGLKDSFRYCSCIEKKELLDRKSYKIE